MAQVGVVFGGRSVEHQVSVNSARAVARGLRAAGHGVTALGIAEDGCWVEPGRGAAVLDGEERAIPPVGAPIAPTLGVLLAAVAGGVEVLFPIVHGSWGEDGTLQGLCEMLDLPYVGPGVTTSAVAMDKLYTKRLLAAAGLPVLPCEAVTRAEIESDPRAVRGRLESLPLPLFVKPCRGGSSVGVKRIDDRACVETSLRFALRFDDTVLVERGIAGR